VADYPTTIRSTAPAAGAGRPAPATPTPRRPRKRRSRAARALAILLIGLGGLVLVDGVVTLLWQEPISALIASIHQDELSGDLARAERAPPSPAVEHALAGFATERRRIAYLAASFERHAGNGSAVGRIVIPRIGASYVVVKGTDTADLEAGPGLYSDTRFPGTGGTTAIAGHRTTFLAPFRHIDSLSPGDKIFLDMPYAHFAYTVIGHRVVEPTDVPAATAEVGYARLVLSACTPLFSAAKRLLVYARLTRTVPVGAARRLLGGAEAQPIETPLHPARPRVLPPVLKSLDTQGIAPVAQ
jgi:sortase A